MPKDSEARPTLVCLHFLGGSATSWSEVVERLSARVRCLPVDLNGFGDAAGHTRYSVTEMADSVADRVGSEGVGDWMIAGHSMGAKVATVLARRAEDGADALGGLRGLALLSGSPPSPEPMEEQKRQTMLD